ncbi:MAG: LamG-like jellyroll fold domain-containing protein [Bacteroidota bacterium]
MKKITLFTSLLLLIIGARAQNTRLSAVPDDDKITLTAVTTTTTAPTHIDIYRGTTNPPTALYTTITPANFVVDWEDTDVDNGVFYYYQSIARDENLDIIYAPSNVTGAMPDAGRGSYYVFDGVDDQVQQLNQDYMTPVDFIGFDFKIDELPTNKNAEIFRLQFKGGDEQDNRSVLSVIHTADELQVVVDRDVENAVGVRLTGISTLTMPSVADGEWHVFLLIGIDGNQLTARIDGILYTISMVGLGRAGGMPLEGVHDIFIGGQANETTAYFTGGFDNLRFFGNQFLEGRWNFDEPTAEPTVFDESRNIRNMQKVGGVSSAIDVFSPITLKAIADRVGKIQLSSNAELVSNNLSSFTFSRQELPSGPVATLKDDLNLAGFFPFEDVTTIEGTPYRYTIDYTAALPSGGDTTVSITDYNVPAVLLGNHYVFDGVNDVVTPNQVLIDDDEGTIELLVKIEPEDSPSGFSYALLGKQNNVFRNGFMILYDNFTAWCQFKDGTGATNNLYPSQGTNLSDGKWHHIALSYIIGESAILYVDGKQVASSSVNNLNFTTAPIQIGRSPDPFGTPLKGTIDEVVIWDQVLSPEEIKNRAFVKARGDEENILALYHFDEVFQSFAYDDSPNQHHADMTVTLVGQNTTEIPIRWVGYENHNWSNSTNWNNGTNPLQGEDIQINASNHYPVISSDDAIAVQDLVLNSGTSLTVESGGILAIKGDLNNDGSITVKRIPEANGKYSMIGSPLTDADVSDFGADLLAEYDALTSNYIEGTGAAFPGTGYFSAYFEAEPEIILTGTPNTGEITTPLITSIESPTSYNLVSNPYTAPISYDEFVTENDGAITGAIWLWDDGGVNVNDSRFGDYLTVNSLGVTDAIGGSTGSSWNGNIGSFQGFFVQTNTNTNLTFKPEMQVTTSGSNDDANHFRVAEEYPHHSIKLSLSGAGFYNEIIVAVSDEATLGEDQYLDAPKLKGNPQFSFYSWLEEEAFAIQALPDLQTIEDIRSIELGFDLTEPGDYQIGVVEMQNIPQDYVLTLTDHLLNRAYVLDETSMIPFSLFEGTLESKRFELSFSHDRVLSEEGQLSNTLSVYADNERLHIHYPSQKEEEVAIYSLDGKKFFHKQVKFENQAVISLGLDSGHLYVLRVGAQSTKFIIN